MPKSEQTGKSVGSKAGGLLGSAALAAAEDRLAAYAAGPAIDETVRVDVLLVLGALTSARSVAASALTQRPTKA